MKEISIDILRNHHGRVFGIISKPTGERLAIGAVVLTFLGSVLQPKSLSLSNLLMKEIMQ